MRESFWKSLGCGVLVVTSLARPTWAAEEFQWDTWGGIVVQDGGRMKPLDTLAWEFVTGVVGRGSLTPEFFSPVSAADIRDWRGLAEKLVTAKGAEGPAGRVWQRLSSDLKAKLEATKLDAGDAKARLQHLQIELAKLQTDQAGAEGEIPTLERLEETRSQSDPAAAKVFAEHREVKAKVDRVEEAKAELLRELNEMLVAGEFYDAKAWSEVKLPEEAVRLGKKEDLGPAERSQLARMRLAAAFPDQIMALEPAATALGLASVQDRKYKPVELYVTWLLTWQGWDKVKDFSQLPRGRNDEIYWQFHEPDAWDQLPMIDARFAAMAPFLKPETQKGVSARSVHANREFDEWIQAIGKKKEQKADLTGAEEKGADVFTAYMNYTHLRLGYNLHVGPNTAKESQDWIPLIALLVENERVKEYDSSKIARVREGFQQARRGLLGNDPAQFNEGSKVFAEALADLGRSSQLYPTPAVIAREIHYNRLQPFFWTAVLAIAATIVLAISVGVKSRIPYLAGFGVLLVAMGMMVYGMYLRIVVSGRPPVTNMYETIIWSAFIASSIAVTLGVVYGHRIIPTTAAVLIALSTLLAYIMPIDMGAAITPLQPVLRSNYWLTVHVLTIVASYGAFLLAWGLGNVGLAYYLMRRDRPEVIKPIAMFTYRSIQVGFLLLAAGTILGGWWAADSWGRFWGWDPKETWAFITLIGYAIILHGRFAGLIQLFGLLVGSVLAFTLVVMAWYGVNFVLGAGLHAYAFGNGGLPYVAAAVLANWLFVGLVIWRFEHRGVKEVAPAAKRESVPVSALGTSS